MRNISIYIFIYFHSYIHTYIDKMTSSWWWCWSWDEMMATKKQKKKTHNPTMAKVWQALFFLSLLFSRLLMILMMEVYTTRKNKIPLCPYQSVRQRWWWERSGEMTTKGQHWPKKYTVWQSRPRKTILGILCSSWWIICHAYTTWKDHTPIFHFPQALPLGYQSWFSVYWNSSHRSRCGRHRAFKAKHE